MQYLIRCDDHFQAKAKEESTIKRAHDEVKDSKAQQAEARYSTHAAHTQHNTARYCTNCLRLSLTAVLLALSIIFILIDSSISWVRATYSHTSEWVAASPARLRQQLHPLQLDLLREEGALQLRLMRWMTMRRPWPRQLGGRTRERTTRPPREPCCLGSQAASVGAR